jgi:hypothetical protein
MIFTRRILIETTDSRARITKKLREVIESHEHSIPKSRYRGVFAEEGFIVLPKTSAASLPHVLIFGEFIKAPKGTNLSITIKFHWIVKGIFWIFNAILFGQFAVRIARHVEDWPLFMGFLLFLWLFFLLQFRYEVNRFRCVIDPLFAESKEVREETPKSFKENNS